MSVRGATVGERISGLEATVAAFETYERDRWHKLAGDLQRLVELPERLTRDVAKIDGKFEGRINSVTKEIERTITTAIEKALEPVTADVAGLKADVEALKLARQQMTGARQAAVWIVQTVLSVLAAVGAVVALGGRHP